MSKLIALLFVLTSLTSFAGSRYKFSWEDDGTKFQEAQQELRNFLNLKDEAFFEYSLRFGQSNKGGWCFASIQLDNETEAHTKAINVNVFAEGEGDVLFFINKQRYEMDVTENTFTMTEADEEGTFTLKLGQDGKVEAITLSSEHANLSCTDFDEKKVSTRKPLNHK